MISLDIRRSVPGKPVLSFLSLMAMIMASAKSTTTSSAAWCCQLPLVPSNGNRQTNPYTKQSLCHRRIVDRIEDGYAAHIKGGDQQSAPVSFSLAWWS